MRMLRSTAVLLLVSGAVLACLGCKEEEPSARKSLGGVEGQSPLKDLDDAQYDAVCDAANDKLEATFEDDDLSNGACLLSAHVSAHAVAAETDGDETEICENAYDGCVDNDVGTMSPCSTGVRSSCTASVNDLDRCLTLAEEIYRELSTLDCEDVSEEDTEALDMRIQASANACDVLIGCFGEDPEDAGEPDASDPILDASELDGSDPVVDASDDDDAG